MILCLGKNSNTDEKVEDSRSKKGTSKLLNGNRDSFDERLKIQRNKGQQILRGDYGSLDDGKIECCL